jgi:tetratricopeptide (TPR) repeat protein
VEQGSKDTVKMREYADLCAQSHQPDEALKYYRKILELNPKRSDIYMNMSFVSFSLGKYDEAKASIEKALQVDKNNALALFNLGIIEAAIGQMDKAKSRWEEVVSRFPKSEIAATAKEQLDRLNQKK